MSGGKTQVRIFSLSLHCLPTGLRGCEQMFDNGGNGIQQSVVDVERAGGDALWAQFFGVAS
jgi:hypothetical protein